MTDIVTALSEIPELRCGSTFLISGSQIRCSRPDGHVGAHVHPKEWWQWTEGSHV